MTRILLILSLTSCAHRPAQTPPGWVPPPYQTVEQDKAEWREILNESTK